MNKKFTIDDVLFRMGYFRNENNLSKRETSSILNHSCSFVNKLENKSTKLKVEVLLEFLEYLDISPMKFFYPNPENFEKDKEILELIFNLSEENKSFVKDFICKIKDN